MYHIFFEFLPTGGCKRVTNVPCKIKASQSDLVSEPHSEGKADCPRLGFENPAHPVLYRELIYSFCPPYVK